MQQLRQFLHRVTLIIMQIDRGPVFLRQLQHRPAQFPVLFPGRRTVLRGVQGQVLPLGPAQQVLAQICSRDDQPGLDLAHILKVFVALGQAQKAFLDHVFTVGMVLQIAESHAIDRRHIFPVQLSQADAGKFQLAFHVLSSLPVFFSPFHKTDEVAERFHAFSFF